VQVKDSSEGKGREMSAGETMTAEDREYAWQHAASWAQGSVLGSLTDEAAAYAGWYYREYVTDAGSLADLPAHSLVWQRYLDSTYLHIPTA
jgi:hypothetical protein